MMEKKIIAKRKPRKCPECGCTKVAYILYGLPAFSPELESELKEGKVVLGGCCVTECDPTWQCIECKAQIYKESDVFPN
jgi:hypothetical protein